LVWMPLLQTTFNALLMMQWAGFGGISSAIASFGMGLPEWPYWGVDKLPGFSQSEIYQQALGENSLPMEYYFIPTDIYLPDWYQNVGGQYVLGWNETELYRAYADASPAFNLMDTSSARNLMDTSGASSMCSQYTGIILMIIMMLMSCPC